MVRIVYIYVLFLFLLSDCITQAKEITSSIVVVTDKLIRLEHGRNLNISSGMKGLVYSDNRLVSLIEIVNVSVNSSIAKILQKESNPEVGYFVVLRVDAEDFWQRNLQSHQKESLQNKNKSDNFSELNLRKQSKTKENNSEWADWTKQYNDPVELAKEVIKRSSDFWNPLGYTTVTATYTVGSFFSMHGYGYLLLESPNLSYDLVTGGFIKLGKTITKDFIFDLIETSIESPKVLCERISKNTIKTGLSDYKIAYEIAREYLKTGQLSEKDAEEFLYYRWGVFKFATARTLWNNSRGNDPQISKELEGKMAKDITRELEKKYQSDIRISTKISIFKACLIISDLFTLLENTKVGLGDFEPYLDFQKNMDYINNLRMNEYNRMKDNPDNISSKTFSNSDLGDINDFIILLNQSIDNQDYNLLNTLLCKSVFHINSYGTRSDYGIILDGKKEIHDYTPTIIERLVSLENSDYVVKISENSEIEYNSKGVIWNNKINEMDQLLEISNKRVISYYLRKINGKWEIYEIYIHV